LWRARRAGADAALVGPVFATASHPGARPLGPLLFAALARLSPLPVYALGGIEETTARRLKAAGAQGFAAIGAFAGA
jgi:thiamine-phosphate pyrophosphorylase